MSSGFDRVIQNLVQIIKESDKNKTSALDAQAEVLRIEEGTAWVHLPGGVDETPVKLTMNAQVGDVVQVRIAGGRAWLTGNATNPPTDDTRANTAYRVANIANLAAESAIRDAGRAFEAANFAEAQAVRAYNEANKAEREAIRANRSANNALTQLGVVQDVVGTLNWISEHGTYTPTEDTVVVADRIYFAYDSATQTYNAVVPVGDENPSEEGWFTLEIDEAVTNYVSTHLALTDSGLWVLYDDDAEYTKATGSFDPTRVYFEYVQGIYVPVVEPVIEDFDKYYIQTIPTGQTSGYKVLIANNGMFVYDSAGALVTTFGENISFSADRSQYIGGDNAYIVFNAESGNMTIGGRDLDIVLGDRSLADALTDMQAEIDGSIETWYEAVDPTLNNPPAVNWITESQKENHLRDLYFNTENGHSFRWAITSTNPKTFGWVQITDADAQKALRDAEIAQQTANSKVAPSEIISSINAQPKPATSSAKIQADYVNIEGAAIFNSGRLSESKLDERFNAKKSVHTLMSANNVGSTYSQILGWCAEGNISSWGVNTVATPIDNVKAGDTVRLAYKVSNMGGAYVYVIGTFRYVDSTGSSTAEISLTMHGIDTTIIDGGNIIANSIGANQIAANAIEIGKLDSSTQTKINNGDAAKTQLTIRDTRSDNQSPQWYISNYPRQEVWEFKYAKTLGLTTDGSYGVLHTTVPWADSSGGWPKQVFEWNSKQYHREGSGSTTWTAWVEDGSIATNYIAIRDSGICIANANPGSQNMRVHIDSANIKMFSSDNVQRVLINSGSGVTVGHPSKGRTVVTDAGLTVYDNNNADVAFFGASARIGIAGAQRVELTSSNLVMYDDKNVERITLNSTYGLLIGRTTAGHAKVNDNGLYVYDINNKTRAQVTSAGLDIFDANGTTNVANFGATARIGASNSYHSKIDTSGFHVWGGVETNDANKIASFGSTTTIYADLSKVSIDGNGIEVSKTNNLFKTYIKSDAIELSSTTSAYYRGRIAYSEEGNMHYLYLGFNGYINKGAVVRVNRVTGQLGIGNNDVWVGTGGGESNHGVYSMVASKWIINLNSDSSAVIPQAGAKTGTSGNPMYVTSNGVLARNTSSSRRYKKDISTLSDEDLNPDHLYDVEVKQFIYKDDYLDRNDQRYGKTIPGFIVEELKDIYPIAVTYEDEQPENWDARYLIPPMLKLIQNQKNELDGLSERINSLERRM